MALYLKIADLPEALAEKVHNLATDTISIALSNTAPSAEASNPTSSGNGVLANVTQISYANYTDDLAVDRVLEGITSNESGGVYTFDASDFVITASGGALADFRYVYIYNDTPTSPADPLIAVIDNEAAISLADGESVTVAWSASGIFTVS